MEICINRTILQRILNDDVESELKQIIDDELSKPDLEIDCSKIDDCINAINLLRAENKTANVANSLLLKNTINCFDLY